ncbi:hypothetical protein ADIARSV_4052 [Arcticibacter svalbardensis MN12-7]|uniref:Uncharacterized protein n=1 Tax=Arcticibacter svalbardensis MN12-7 TaxID=1150600 RepID=R9GML8_9SPHI|nr:hypothetical protein [Arcticibacter svalbardensis]EOR92770.1 hypothetical protein ADIARSV_4052 [Arcticibacter svalbardensis MN12-7]
MQTNFRVLEWSKANDLRLLDSSELIENIPYNLSSVYKTKDLQYVILPINPFAKALITSDRSEVDKWIAESFFPTEESVNSFYFKNKLKIDNFPQSSIDLVKELEAILPTRKGDWISQDLDEVYKILQKRKLTTKYKLNFIALVGNALMASHPELKAKWGVLFSKQLLNPVASISLYRIIDGEERYLNLEVLISGKYGYRGMQSIERSFLNRWYLPNDIDEIKNL